MVDLRHPDDPTIIQKVADWSIVSSCTATHASTNRQTDIPAGLMLTIPIIYIYIVLYLNIHIMYVPATSTCAIFLPLSKEYKISAP